ncbi:MAG: serine hydrolase domain-containing protein [Chloroflexota bacterium]|nr:MAG: hypothetical protein DIU68_15275 [Chloroflexota bacterium]
MLNIEAIERRVADLMDAAIVPGMALAVTNRDEVIYARGFGATSTEPDAPAVGPDTIFRIGSITKPLTATMLMRLVDDGLLDLDRPVREYVPWLKLMDEDAERIITLRMLLSHTSGLPTALEYNGWRDPSGLEAYVREVLPALPPVAPPGEIYAYSNPGFNLAGYVAEAVTGTPYAELMRQYLFEPLGMGRTTFDPLVAMTYPFSQSFVLDETGRPQVKRPFVDNTGEYPCGFALSTVLDLGKLARLHLNDGCVDGVSLLSANAVAEMRRLHVELMTLDGRGYGLGMRVRQYKGLRLVGHNGAIAKYGGLWWLVPEAGIAVVMLMNRAPNAWGVADRLLTSLLDDLLELPEPAAEPVQIAAPAGADDLTGIYLGPSVGLVQVENEGETLSMRWNGRSYRLEARGDRLFKASNPAGDSHSVGFVRAGEGEIRYLYLDGSPCIRQHYTLESADISAWERAPGVYRADIDTWRLRCENGQFWIYSEDERAEVPCVLLDARRFVCDFGLFELEEDGAGRLTLLGGGGYWRFPKVCELADGDRA